MKICFWHFYTFRMRRGIETLVVSLANALVKIGIEVSIVTAAPSLELFVKPDPRVKIFSYPTFRYFEHITIAPFYFYHFQKHSYDHVVTFFSDFGEGLTCQLLKPFQKLPLVLYLCYPRSTVKHRYDSFLKYGWDKSLKKVMAVAKWIADEAEPVLKHSISILPPGMDPEKMKPNPDKRIEMRRKHGYSEEDVVLLNVAALEQRKGAWRVIESLGRLKDKLPNLKYFILGKGIYEQELKTMVKRLNLEARVIFGGETAQHPDYYNMSDVFIMLPDAEANSLASVEAMSSGLPMIVSNNGGFQESVPQNSGILVNLNEPYEIDAAIIKLAQEPDLRQECGRNARLEAKNRFSWDKIAKRFLEIIEP